MPNSQNNPEDLTPLPAVATPPEPEPPQGGWGRYRLVIICGLVLAFMVYLFAAKESRMIELETSPGKILAKSMEKPLTGILKPEPRSRMEMPAGPGGPPEGSGATPEPAAKPEPALAEPPVLTRPDIAPKPEEPVIPAAPVPPAVKHGEPAVKGEAFTQALIKIMDDQVNKPLFGWRPNAILFGKFGLTDDVNNLQLGVLEVARRTVVVLNENMSRFALTEAQNPYLNNAMNFVMVSPEKYWFPSASGKYQEAMANLEHYIDDLKHNRSRFYTRVDNLIALMNHFRDVLGSAFHNLIKDKEADGSPVSWFVSDDYFYFAQGVAIGMAGILEGVKEDFADQLAKKNSSKLVEDAIHALHEASHLHPWLITNAKKDGVLANHRANMGTFIGEAEHIIFTLMNVLATN